MGQVEGIDVSIVIPAYNEEEALPLSIPPLAGTLRKYGVSHEIILIDNGSTDRTSEVIASLMKQFPAIRTAKVEINRGYGEGVVFGYKYVRGKIVGHMCADGQISELDVFRIILEAEKLGPRYMVKARRVHRDVSLPRRISSWVNRKLFFSLFGPICRDVNGTPKFLYNEHFQKIRPTNEGDFLDAEFVIKASRLGLKIHEVPTDFLERVGGISKVGSKFVKHAIKYIRSLFYFRFSPVLTNWKRDIQ